MEPKFEPKQHTPEEIAALEKSRTISDAELLKGGAEYVVDEKGERRLKVAPEQIPLKAIEHEEIESFKKDKYKYNPEKEFVASELEAEAEWDRSSDEANEKFKNFLIEKLSDPFRSPAQTRETKWYKKRIDLNLVLKDGTQKSGTFHVGVEQKKVVMPHYKGIVDEMYLIDGEGRKISLADIKDMKESRNYPG